MAPKLALTVDSISPTSAAVSSTANSGTPAQAFYAQWTRPKDVFSVLLLLGGDVINRALAQLVGGRLTPVTFSFGWVAYAAAAVVSSVGDNKLMPAPDCTAVIINGENGFVRENSSWIIGRIVRDFESWMRPETRSKVRDIIDEAYAVRRAQKAPGELVERPTQAGLCVTIYEADGTKRAGIPNLDRVHYSGIVVMLLQVALASIPCGQSPHDWSILLITACGIGLALFTGSLSQWKKEKWSCRRNCTKTEILTRGNGSQNAIVIRGNGVGLNLEDLAGQSNVDSTATPSTRLWMILLSFLWIALLISAAGLSNNTWYLLGVGGIGSLHTAWIAGTRRRPEAFGVHLNFVEVIGHHQVSRALLEVETEYEGVGRSLLATFFPGTLRPDEAKEWASLRMRRENAAAVATHPSRPRSLIESQDSAEPRTCTGIEKTRVMETATLNSAIGSQHPEEASLGHTSGNAQNKTSSASNTDTELGPTRHGALSPS